MTRHARRLFLCGLSATLVVGCTTTAPSRFYTLNATVAAEGSPAPLANVSVAVGPIWMPQTVDRPQIVLRTGANRVTLDEFNQWADPLPNNVARVIAQNLIRLLGTSQVTLYPQGTNLNPQYRVESEVLRFESAPGEAASLEALWTVRRTRDGATQTGRTEVREAVSGPSIDALVAAHSRALATLSVQVADAIRVLDRAEQQAILSGE
jgi:uncharacterized lipoprotein YmbA